MAVSENLKKCGLLALPIALVAAGAPLLLTAPFSGPGPEARAVRTEAAALPQQIPIPPDVGGDHGFRFVRIMYTDVSEAGGGRGGGRGRGWGRGRERWATDYPSAEENLDEAITRTSNLFLEGDPIVLRLDDERIFEYPYLYLTEPGYWYLEEEEIPVARRYLEQGGFLHIDDFHDYGGKGSQWINMYENLKQILPDREPVPVPPDHSIWSIYYDIDPIEAPSTKDYEGFGKYDDEYYAVYDDDGRMMVFISYKQDIGDGWEWPDRNLHNASTISFQMAINVITWALTH